MDFKELAYVIVGLGGLKSIGDMDRLESQGRADIKVLRPKAVWRQNSFLFRRFQPFLLRPSTDELRPIHVIEGNWPHLESTDLSVNHTFKIPSQQHLNWCLTKELATPVQPC